ncbi:hypothetical protein SAMN02910418_00325 [Bowdeniella nasicola]|uniref:Uncharacterized protein n=1 Tax=Bowdeniella nasicola TaxID=208480 RepID=A0A1H3W8H3_9ACTO|nr:hypothetical protein SAMN02910418_00325 [Bowdeniella nasicola]
MSASRRVCIFGESRSWIVLAFSTCLKFPRAKPTTMFVVPPMTELKQMQPLLVFIGANV